MARQYVSFPDSYRLHPRSPNEAIAEFLSATPVPLLDAGTPVTSLGSCFADNIRLHLKQRGFNYLQVEPDCHGYTANWGRVYNTGCLRQVFDYSTTQHFDAAERWWTGPDGLVHDPFRPIDPYTDVASAEADFACHMACSQEALSRAEVLILTVGLTETWRSTASGQFFHGRPLVPDVARHRFHVMTYEEVLADLTRVRDLARTLRPDVRFVLTVSPVPLRATFRTDVNAISATAHSKAVLLAATRAFCESHDDTYYFPSFEVVKDAIGARLNDRGNYDATVIETVMRIFDHQFVHGAR